jgi:O-antigen ligase
VNDPGPGLPATASPLLATSPSPTVIALIAVGAALVIAALALLMRRRPDALPLLVIAALPFRLPISAEGRTVNLLIPLYTVVAAGTIAQLLPRLLRGRERRPEGFEWLLLAAVALYAAQALYSSDIGKAAENMAFFYVPFALLFLLLRDVRWTRELLLRCLAIAVALAVLFAGLGFIEYARKSLFLNPKVVAANQFDNYFRVNSVFFDPNVYGRFLALVMIALATIVLWGRTRRDVLASAAALAWLLAGLVTSFSQSSIAALLLGLAVLAAWRWDVRATLFAAGGLVVLALAVVLLAPASLHFGLKGSGGSTSNATSGRTKLITHGLELFAERPVQGYGSGSFQTEYERHSSANQPAGQNATTASHTIPVTVAAEQGLVGLGVYVAFLAGALLTLFGGAGRSPPRMAIAACFAALVLHTWAYADFLEDPVTWTLLGIGVALARENLRACSTT